MLRRGPDQRKTSRKPRRAERNAAASDSASRRGGRGRPGSAGKAGPQSLASAFVLYVEGARDREILEHWARRVNPELSRVIQRNAVILGGRRPARAISDFRKRGGAGSGLKGLVVLDRDHHQTAHTGNEGAGAEVAEEGLEVFIWGRRHIESYLLVPAVLRRLVGLDPDDRRIERLVEEEEHGPESLHAKRILGTGGSLSEVLGAELRAGQIARAMRREHFHPDILDLFQRVARGAGLVSKAPEVIVRARPKS